MTGPVSEMWRAVRLEILRRIEEEVEGLPEKKRGFWPVEASDGDMREFPTIGW